MRIVGLSKNAQGEIHNSLNYSKEPFSAVRVCVYLRILLIVYISDVRLPCRAAGAWLILPVFIRLPPSSKQNISTRLSMTRQFLENYCQYQNTSGCHTGTLCLSLSLSLCLSYDMYARVCIYPDCNLFSAASHCEYHSRWSVLQRTACTAWRWKAPGCELLRPQWPFNTAVNLPSWHGHLWTAQGQGTYAGIYANMSSHKKMP